MHKQLISSFVMLSCTSHAGGNMNQATERIQPIVQVLETKEKKDFFAFALGGVSFFDVEVTRERDTSLRKGTFDDKGSVFEVGVGYHFTENIFTELVYQRSMLDIENVDSGYLSLNYQFQNIMLTPYIGIVSGYSKLKWSKRPHVKVINENLTSKSSLYGMQTGLNLPISDDLSLTAKYQYIKLNHLMNIRNGTALIKHNQVQNLLLGVKYEF